MKNCTEGGRSYQLCYLLKMLVDVEDEKYEMAII